VIGEGVEITIRGRRGFTFSTEAVVADLADRLTAYFGARIRHGSDNSE